jgi:hypothetical protein
MKTSYYFRSEILNFFELPEKCRNEYFDQEDDSFVYDEEKEEALPLSSFVKLSEPGLFDGFFGMSYFSAYFIKVSKCGTAAVVAYKHW